MDIPMAFIVTCSSYQKPVEPTRSMKQKHQVVLATLIKRLPLAPVTITMELTMMSHYHLQLVMDRVQKQLSR